MAGCSAFACPGPAYSPWADYLCDSYKHSQISPFFRGKCETLKFELPLLLPAPPPLPSFHSGLLTESPALCCHLLPLSTPQFSPHSGNGGCDCYEIDLCFHQAASWPLAADRRVPRLTGGLLRLLPWTLWHLTPLATPS